MPPLNSSLLANVYPIQTPIGQKVFEGYRCMQELVLGVGKGALFIDHFLGSGIEGFHCVYTHPEVILYLHY